MMGNNTSECAWPEDGLIVYDLKDEPTQSSLVSLGFNIIMESPDDAIADGANDTCALPKPKVHMRYYGVMSVPHRWKVVPGRTRSIYCRNWTVRDTNGVPRVKIGGTVTDRDFGPKIEIASEEESELLSQQLAEEARKRVVQKEALEHDPVAIYERALRRYQCVIDNILAHTPPVVGREMYQPAIDGAYLTLKRAFDAVPDDRKGEVRRDLPHKTRL